MSQPNSPSRTVVRTFETTRGLRVYELAAYINSGETLTDMTRGSGRNWVLLDWSAISMRTHPRPRPPEDPPGVLAYV
jgi:hypothetical protein